ncbi:MAG: helix-turn-helix domain-containing protein [Verrucomicrobiota bacterium]|nr:helix-turn-helix domain-containing protein [Verrucomicrobiota bacterium]
MSDFRSSLSFAPAMVPDERSGPGVDSLHETAGPKGPENRPRWVMGRDLAAALGVSKKTVHQRAQNEGWQIRTRGNRFEYLPPSDLFPDLAVVEPEAVPVAERCGFMDLTHDPKARETVLLRERAVQSLAAFPGTKENARAQVVAMFASRHPQFNISKRSLERWEVAYESTGINGLVDQKRGRVGRKGVEIPEELRRRAQAEVIEKGSIARAARNLAAHPNLPANLRKHLHGAHASKSHVTGSIRKALRVDPSLEALNRGPKHARLAGRFTPGSYADVTAGFAFVSDDMTSNVYCWTEWPNAQGFKIGQPQILPVLDVGSLLPLGVRVIMREGGQYNSDDIWGLMGDVFDTVGLPRKFVLEGGNWQAQKIRGFKTDISGEERIGGLSSLGVDVCRSYDPRSKIIETWFNQFQYECDAIAGYAGREQRTQLPDIVKNQLALCKIGQAHPRQFFLQLKEFSDHVAAVMERLSHERQDGEVLRGMSPQEKWVADNPALPKLADKDRWIYRSAMAVERVTKNGIRITQGSGRNLQVYYYDSPSLALRTGSKVIVYWNDHNPDAQAVVLDHATRQFICLATLVPKLARFNATPEQLAAEAKRKSEAMAYSRSELRAIAPELHRRSMPIVTDGQIAATGARIAQANAAAQEKDSTQREIARAVRNAEVTDSDRAAVLGDAPADQEQNLVEQFSDLFSEPPSENENPISF